MRAQLAPLLGTLDSGGALALVAQASTEGYSGRLRSSLEFSRQGVKIARSAQFNDLAVQARIADSLREAYLLQDDKTKAHEAYQNFLALWKGADPDIAVLKQAKAEYAKVQ